VKNILIYKLVLLNTLAIAWLSITNYQTDWFGKLVHSDTTGINYATLGLFVLVLLATMFYAFKLNKAFNIIVAEPNRRWMVRKKNFEWIERAAGWMLFLGLIGTLYGLMISLSGVNTGNINSVDGLKTIGVQLISGLRIEISTTLIGAIMAMWTEVNYTIVKHTADHFTSLEVNQ
jgi:hypothetical protein